MWLESDVGRGSTFSFRLPLERTTEAGAASEPPAGPAGGGPRARGASAG